ncbi:RNA polymerase sigma factor [Rapidithrix thailandica]|uniref:RNA polymerase sigma factor n=1 Tax=Rapidithrix thailandica TaxID=413964 RepID=A0AAW9RZ70_9BACT
MSLNSTSLVEKACQGNQAAFNKLVNLWYQRVYNFCFNYFSDHDRAMEATQKTFIALHQHLPSLQKPNLFKSWLYRIAINFCHEEERKQKRRGWFFWNTTEKSGEGKTNTSWTSTLPNPEEALQQQELASLLAKALKSLPEEQRVVVIMKEYEGLKFKEIAEVLKMSENTVKSRMYYGLKALRKILEKWNIHQENIDYGAQTR